MNLTEVAVTLSLTLGVSVAAIAAMNIPGTTGTVRSTGDKATCHTLGNAYAAYSAQHGTPPRQITDLRPYVSGDLAAYRVTPAGVAGPGCAAATR